LLIPGEWTSAVVITIGSTVVIMCMTNRNTAHAIPRPVNVRKEHSNFRLKRTISREAAILPLAMGKGDWGSTLPGIAAIRQFPAAAWRCVVLKTQRPLPVVARAWIVLVGGTGFEPVTPAV